MAHEQLKLKIKPHINQDRVVRKSWLIDQEKGLPVAKKIKEFLFEYQLIDVIRSDACDVITCLYVKKW